MALFSTQDLDANEDLLREQLSIDLSEQERDQINQEMQAINLKTKTFGELYGSSVTAPNTSGAGGSTSGNEIGSEILRAGVNGELAILNSANGGPMDFNLNYPDIETDITGSNIGELFISDPDRNLKARREFTNQYTHLMSADYAIEQKFDRWLNRDLPKMSPDEANVYAESMGADIKFNKPASEFEVKQSVDTYLKRKGLENSLAMLNSTGSYGFFRDASVWASGLAGGTGPIEVTSSLALGWAVPEASIAGLAKTAQLTKNALRIKKGMDLNQSIKTAKTINSIVAGASAPVGSAERTAVSVILKNSEAGARAIKAEERTIKALQTLEKIQGLRYDKLTNMEKTGLDALTFLLVDRNFINTTLDNSKELGWDLYTEKDKAMDTLLALGLGVFIPSGVRSVGKALGISPTALLTRKLDDMEIDVKAKEALGEITPEQATEARRAIAEIRKSEESMKSVFKKPDPYFERMARDIRIRNISNETLVAQRAYILNQLVAGNRPKIQDIPQFESILSHINAMQLRGLKRKDAKSVFKSALLREKSGLGNFRVRIQGETGLLGSRFVTALTEEEALTQLENMYKGMVLGDKQAASAFKQWANRYTTFAKELTEIYSVIQSQLQANMAAKNEKKRPAFGGSELINVRTSMRRAFLKYKLGEGYIKVEDSVLNKDMIKALGFDPDEFTPEVQKVLNDFEDFYAKYVTESWDDNGIRLYDLITVSGEKYGRTYLEDLLDELKEGSENNSYLAQVDDIISTWSQEKVNSIVKSAMYLDVSPDTDLDNLLGSPRRTYDSLMQSVNEKASWEAQLVQERIEYDKVRFREDTKKAMDVLKEHSSSDPSIVSNYNRLLSTLDEIRQLKTDRYINIKAGIVDKLRASESFQQKIVDLMNGNTRVVKGIELAFRDIVAKSLSESGYAAKIGNLGQVTRDAVAYLRQEIEAHPENLEALLRGADIEALSKIPEFGATERRTAIAAENMVKIDNLLKPIEVGLDIAFARAELQTMHDISLYADKMALMLAFPENAAEILTGAATQTITVFRGARRSVEYLTKTAGFYTNDLKNQLRNMESSSVKGQSLLDYYQNKSNQEAITQSFVNMKHGVMDSGNADADRIAKAILDQESSFLGAFRKLGSSYTNPSTVVKKSKLNYADTAIQEAEVDDIVNSVKAASLDISPESFVESLPRVNNAGEIRMGYKLVLPDKEVVKDVKDTLAEIYKSIKDLNSIANPNYRKMAFWAFRDFDLDKMFDPDGTSMISLNEIRDALLQGDITPLLDGDLYRLKYINGGLKRIRTSLIGRNTKEISETALAIDPISWVYRFKNSFTDIGAVIKGRKSAAIDAFEGGIHFKNPDSEMNAARLFGYDNINEHVQSAFESMFQAYYSLSNFGSRPLDMVNELMDTYNIARTSDEDTAKRIQEYTAKRKNPKPGEKFAITEGARDSVIENVMLACGLQNSSPSTATRVLKSVARFLSTSLLVKAGLRSLSDYSTIWEGMITNGMVQGRTEAMALSGRATQQLIANRDLMHLVLGTTLLQQDDVFKRMSNDPGADIMKVSESASLVDKFEALSNRYANFMMNDFAQLTSITNSNKNVAGYGIQMAVGNSADTAYDDLNKWFQYALLRESIMKEDWEFIRTNLVKDFNEYIFEKTGKKLKGESYKLLVPLSIREIPDEVIAKELSRRGELNVTPEAIDNFRIDIASKVWNMVDTGADEMVSIPSGRVANILRGGKARNSGWGSVLDLVTQFQSFGAALLFNTYGKRLANFAAEETGVSLIDLFNPNVKLANSGMRSAVYMNTFGMMLAIGMSMLVVDTAVSALSGQIQKPIGPDGKIHADSALTAMLGAMGAGGVVMDAAIEGIEGSGQRGGGFALQVFPSLSNLLRTGYRLTVPLRSSRVPEGMKGEAFAAAAAQELARFSGLRSAPIISLVYQDLVGAWLDSRIKGGYEPYNTYIRNRESRGMVIMPWERYPEPVWEQLQ